MKGKYRFLAGLLSVFMLLSAIIMPRSMASDVNTIINTPDELNILIPKKGLDSNEDAKPRQLRYFKVYDNVVDDGELLRIRSQYEAMTMADVVKDLGEGELTEPSTVYTDKSGNKFDLINVKDLTEGTYVFKETDDSARDHEYKVIAFADNIKKGLSTGTVIMPKVKVGKKQPVTLHKYAYEEIDGKTTTINLEGVKFELLSVDDDEPIGLVADEEKGFYHYSASAETTTIELVTNKDGNIVISDLPEGQYVFRETEPIDDYIIEEGEEETTFNYNPYKAEIISIKNSKDNDEEKGTDAKIHLHKYDADTRLNLEGVEFKLFLKQGDIYTPAGKKEDGEFGFGDGVDNTYITDKDGNIILKDLPKVSIGSSYVFRESKTLDGYVFTSDIDYVAPTNKVVEVSNTKKPQPLEITLNKVDSITNAPLDRVGFELYREKIVDEAKGTARKETERVGLTGANGSYKFDEAAANTERVYQLFTDSKGQITVTGLPEGKYFFRENQPREGYKTSPENNGKESIRLSRDNNETTMVNRPDTPTPPPVTPPNTPNNPPTVNTPPTGNYNFVKVDDSTERKRLGGALFALYKVGNDGQVSPYEVNGRRYTVRSGENGEFSVSGLPYGKYVLRETSAPSGHLLNVNPIEFEISATSYANQAIFIVNERTPDRPTTPPVVSPPATPPTNPPSNPPRVTTPPNVSPPGTTPPRVTTPPTVSPPGTTYNPPTTTYTPPTVTYEPPTTTRTPVPPVVSPPGTTYYVPEDTPGIPRGPLVKTGDIRIVILVALGLIMIIAGIILVKKSEREQVKLAVA